MAPFKSCSVIIGIEAEMIAISKTNLFWIFAFDKDAAEGGSAFHGGRIYLKSAIFRDTFRITVGLKVNLFNSENTGSSFWELKMAINP